MNIILHIILLLSKHRETDACIPCT